MKDGFHDECGLFGIFAHPDAARLTSYCAKTRSADFINIKPRPRGFEPNAVIRGRSNFDAGRPCSEASGNDIPVRLRCLSIVIPERSAKPLPTFDATVGPAGFPRWRDEFVIKTLVIPLQMIMGDESANTRAEVILSQRYHAAKALALDGSRRGAS